MTDTTRVTRLTGMNIRALRETLTPEQADRVALTKTTATFYMDRAEALALMVAVKTAAAAKHGGTGHPVGSLHAVIRKLAETKSVPCEYFAKCDRDAIGTVPNPVVGDVPTCQRCADHVGVTLVPFA